MKKKFKLIACDVFMRELCSVLAQTPHCIDPEFIELGAHLKSDGLRERLQAAIVAAEASPRNYDAILLCYGLCGNAIVGLHSTTIPLVIPRAHDCCTILLGGTARFKQYFGDHPSMPFTSPGYNERSQASYAHEALLTISTDKNPSDYKELVEMYGEEHARYLIEAMNPQLQNNHSNKLMFIEIPEIGDFGYRKTCQEQAASEGREFVQLKGSLELIKKLVFEEWDEKEFLVVKPGQKVQGVYDWDQIISA